MPGPPPLYPRRWESGDHRGDEGTLGAGISRVVGPSGKELCHSSYSPAWLTTYASFFPSGETSASQASKPTGVIALPSLNTWPDFALNG
jgi:hypothetical protein